MTADMADFRPEDLSRQPWLSGVADIDDRQSALFPANCTDQGKISSQHNAEGFVILCGYSDSPCDLRCLRITHVNHEELSQIGIGNKAVTVTVSKLIQPAFSSNSDRTEQTQGGFVGRIQDQQLAAVHGSYVNRISIPVESRGGSQ